MTYHHRLCVGRDIVWTRDVSTSEVNDSLKSLTHHLDKPISCFGCFPEIDNGWTKLYKFRDAGDVKLEKTNDFLFPK